MCGRYASSRRPEDLVEEFEIDRVEVPEALPPDYNVAPTKQVYAVVQRPVGAGDEPGPTERQLRTVKWGLVPFWAKDPSVGNRMINARMETVHEKPAYRRPFASRRCLLPADGYFEWYPTEQRTKAGKPVKQKTERVKLVAQLVSYLHYSMTPTGLLLWFENEACSGLEILRVPGKLRKEKESSRLQK